MPDLSTVAGPLVSLATAAVLWNFRRHAKRLEIIDLATKRAAFWDQFLKVEFAATSPESAEQKQSKEMAHGAIQRIHSDADYELRRLEWFPNLRRQGILQGLLKVKLPSRDQLSITDQINWWILIAGASSLMWFFLYLCITFPASPDPPFLLSLSRMTMLIASAFGSGWMAERAELLKHPRPQSRIIDKM